MIKILIQVTLVFLATASLAQSDKQKHASKLAENGDLKQAIIILDEVIKSNPPKASYYQDKTNYLLGLKDYQGAMKTLSAAIELMPDSVSLYDMRGALLEAFGLYNEAIEDFTAGYVLEKDNKRKSHLLSNRGGTKVRIQDYHGAYSDLTEAIKLDPVNVDALNNLAAVSDEVGRPNETLGYLEKVISINPNYAPAYVNMGFRYQQREQHTKAIEYFNKAIKIDPTEALAYSNLSFSKLKTKDIDGAMKDINQSLELMPSNSYGYKIRALIQIEKGMRAQACSDLNKAIELGYEQQYGAEVTELIAKNCKN